MKLAEKFQLRMAQKKAMAETLRHRWFPRRRLAGKISPGAAEETRIAEKVQLYF
ncbi:MAG: hypothetical protein HFE64_05350 [Lachnospiraceae bacterium]|nr:hypothetical protein [Lachnospiraceae bacterium]